MEQSQNKNMKLLNSQNTPSRSIIKTFKLFPNNLKSGDPSSDLDFSEQIKDTPKFYTEPIQKNDNREPNKTKEDQNYSKYENFDKEPEPGISKFKLSRKATKFIEEKVQALNFYQKLGQLRKLFPKILRDLAKNKDDVQIKYLLLNRNLSCKSQLTKFQEIYDKQYEKSENNFEDLNLLHYNVVSNSLFSLAWNDIIHGWIAYSISSMIQIIQVLLLKNFIDQLTDNEPNYFFVIGVALVTLLFTFLGPLIQNNSRFFEAAAKTKIRQTLRILIFEKLMISSPTFVKLMGRGNLFDMVINDIDTIADFYGSMSVLFTLPIIIVFYTGYLMYRVGLVVVLLFPLFVFTMILLTCINFSRHSLDVKLRGLRQKGIDLLSELLIHLKSVKFHSLEALYLERINKNKISQLNVLDRLDFVGRISSFFVALTPAISSMVILSVYIKGKSEDSLIANDRGSLDATTGLFLIVFISKLQGPLTDLTDYIIKRQKAQISLKVFSQYLHLGWANTDSKFEGYKPENKRKFDYLESNVYQKVLNIRFIGKVQFREEDQELMRSRIRLLFEKYSMTRKEATEEQWTVLQRGKLTAESRPVFEVEDLEICEQEKVCLLGQENSGKHYLFLALKEELKVSSGILDHNLTMSYIDFSLGLSTLFLSGRNIKENILMGEPSKQIRLIEILEMVGFDLSYYPGGELFELTERGDNLRPKDRYILLLARALYPDRDLYMFRGLLTLEILERFSWMSQTFRRVVKNYLSKKIVIYDTNDARIASISDKLIVFKDNRILEIGTFENIKKSKNFKSSQLLVTDRTMKSMGMVVDEVFNLKGTKKKNFSQMQALRGARGVKKLKTLIKREKKRQGAAESFRNINTDFFKGLAEGMKLQYEKTSKGKYLNNKDMIFNFYPVLRRFLMLRGTISVFFVVFVLFIYLSIKIISVLYFVPWSSQWFGEHSPLFYLFIYVFLLGLQLAFLLMWFKLFHKEYIGRIWILHKNLISKIFETNNRWFLKNPYSRLLTRMIRDWSLINSKLAINLIDFCFAIGLLLISVTMVLVCYPVVSLVYLGFFFWLRTRYYSKFVKVVELFAIENAKRSQRLLEVLDQTLNTLDQARTNKSEDFLRKNFMNASNSYQQVFSHLHNYSLRYIKWCLVKNDVMNMAFSLLMSLAVVNFWKVLESSTSITPRSMASLGITFTIMLNFSFSRFWITYTRLTASIVSIASVFEFIQHEDIEPEGEIRKPIPGCPLIELNSIRFNSSRSNTAGSNSLGVRLLENRRYQFIAPATLAIFGNDQIEQSKFFDFLAGFKDTCSKDKQYEILAKNLNFKGSSFESWNKQEFRKNVFILEGDAFNFEGTLKQNLDPENKFGDDKLVQALSYVGFLELMLTGADHSFMEGSTSSSGGGGEGINDKNKEGVIKNQDLLQAVDTPLEQALSFKGFFQRLDSISNFNVEDFNKGNKKISNNKSVKSPRSPKSQKTPKSAFSRSKILKKKSSFHKQNRDSAYKYEEQVEVINSEKSNKVKNENIEKKLNEDEDNFWASQLIFTKNLEEKVFTSQVKGPLKIQLGSEYEGSKKKFWNREEEISKQGGPRIMIKNDLGQPSPYLDFSRQNALSPRELRKNFTQEKKGVENFRGHYQLSVREKTNKNENSSKKKRSNSENFKSSRRKKISSNKAQAGKQTFVQVTRRFKKRITMNTLKSPQTPLWNHKPPAELAEYIHKILNQNSISFGGQNTPLVLKRMILLARCLLIEPELVLIRGDGLRLGIHCEQYYMAMLKMQLNRSLIFCFPSNLKLTEYYDQVIYLRDGVVREIGDPLLLVKDGSELNDMLTETSLGELNKLRERFTMGSINNSVGSRR